MDIEVLRHEYLINKKGVPTIAREFNYPQTTLYSMLRKYGIQRRGPAGKILVDYTDKQYGGWTVIKKHKIKRATWICRCVCGVEKPVKSSVFLKCGKCNNCRKTGCGDITGTRWSNIKNGATQRSIEFSISVEYAWNLYVQQNKKCALTGELIYFAPRKKNNPTRTASNVSLDRIDSSKGYEVGNVQWVLKKINMMKQDDSQEEFISLCRLVTKYNEQ